MKKVIINLITCIVCVMSVKAQQINNSGFYHLDRYTYNPAGAGTKPYLFLSGSYCKYWTGFEGSPLLQTFTAHKLISERVGLGGKLFNENTGLGGKFGAEISYAYHIPVTSGGAKIAFGLSGVISQYNLFKDKFVVDDPDDEAIKYAENSLIVPDAACGLSFYKPDNWWINLSVAQLLGGKVSFLNKENLENRQIRHYFAELGYQYTISNALRLEPSAMVKITETGIYQADIGLNALIKKMFYIGCYYRTNDAILPFFGIDARNVCFGYSYGIVISDIGNYTNGSHEIILIIKLNNTKSSLDSEVGSR